ncbi:hypothetical protein EX30DRAFT_338082, partial [Ascodesmis nigricans]
MPPFCSPLLFDLWVSTPVLSSISKFKFPLPLRVRVSVHTHRPRPSNPFHLPPSLSS